MTDLADILNRYAAEPALGGNTSTMNTKQLSQDLREGISQHDWLVYLICALLAILFVISLVLVFWGLLKPDMMKYCLSALGISSCGCITALGHLWRERTRLQMLAVIASHATPDDVKKLVDALRKSVLAEATKIQH